MNNKDIKVIFWDFDGVLMNSNKVRDLGFLEVLKEFPKTQVDKLMKFHQANGGLSRYVKFRYFFEDIRGESITEEDVQDWANKFSSIMLDMLINEELLIKETVDFVKKNHHKYNMHIVSGSDGKELNIICEGVGIKKYFRSIEGSPTPKKDLVKNILTKNKYNNNFCYLIGDSINDYEAAMDNKIGFLGFGNQDLVSLSTIKNIIFE